MSRNEKATTTGAVTGGVVGAAVGGPVGAAVGAGAGGYVGHESAGSSNATASNRASTSPSHAASANNTMTSASTANANGTASSSSRPGTVATYPSTSSNYGASGSNNTLSNNASGNMATGTDDGASTGSGPGGMSAQNSQDTIRSVQQNLNDRGYNAGPVDGIVGPRTRAALKEFQQSNGLNHNGQLDSETLAALGVEQSSPQQLVNQTASNGTSYTGTTEHAIQQSTGVPSSSGNPNAAMRGPASTSINASGR